jgi:hypothetical protein
MLVSGSDELLAEAYPHTGTEELLSGAIINLDRKGDPTRICFTP